MAWSLRGDFMKDRTVLIICGIAIIVSALFAAYIINDTLSISTTEFHYMKMILQNPTVLLKMYPMIILNIHQSSEIIKF